MDNSTFSKMECVATSIKDLHKSQIKILLRDEPYFRSTFHSHPEFELVYIIEGFGKRIIGNKIESFNKEELVLIGPNTPHIWVSDESFHAPGVANRSKALVVYFNPEIFSEGFYEMEDSFYVNKLFKQSKQGVMIEGNAKDQTVALLQRMLQAQGFEKVICLLEIINTISVSGDLHYINQQNSLQPSSAGSNRLSDLFDYINLNYKNLITLKQAAKITNQTPESFCRFFKQKTGKTFSDYLHETRIFYACRSLLNTDLTVAEIAYGTGFKTAPAFNKLFKKLTGNSPTGYRKMLTANTACSLH